MGPLGPARCARELLPPLAAFGREHRHPTARRPLGTRTLRRDGPRPPGRSGPYPPMLRNPCSSPSAPGARAAAGGRPFCSLREAFSLPRGRRPSPRAALRAPPEDAPARATEQGVPRWGPSLSPAARCVRAGASTPHRETPARDPHAPARWASAPGAVRPPPTHAAEALLIAAGSDWPLPLRSRAQDHADSGAGAPRARIRPPAGPASKRPHAGKRKPGTPAFGRQRRRAAIFSAEALLAPGHQVVEEREVLRDVVEDARRP